MDIYTDGSAYYKDRTGGWAFVLIDNNKEIYQDFGNQKDTTISIMEMTAVYNSLKFIRDKAINEDSNEKFRIFCDSAFVVKAFNERWYMRWVESEWYGVKNSDLWKKILKLYLMKDVKVEFVKIKGHSGNVWNDVVDFYAGTARKLLKENE
jgi:ribonuclease HI